MQTFLIFVTRLPSNLSSILDSLNIKWKGGGREFNGPTGDICKFKYTIQCSEEDLLALKLKIPTLEVIKY